MAPFASKFESEVSRRPCSWFAHPWCQESCTKGIWEMITSCALGTAPGTLIFHLVKLALRIQETKASSERHREIMRLPGRVLRATLFGACLGGGIVSSMCLIRRIFGRFHYYTLAFLPGCVGGLAIFTQRKEDLHYFLGVFYVAAVEYVVRQVARKRIVPIETVLFIMLNSSLSYLQRCDTSGTPLPWFHKPLVRHAVVSASDTPVRCPQHWRPCCIVLFGKRHHCCKHQEPSCLLHAIHGGVKFFLIGTALSFVRYAVPRFRELMSTQHSTRKGTRVIAWRLAKFFGIYVALFRLTRCSLCWLKNEDAPVHAAISGALAGISYILHPSLAIFAAALASAAQVRRNENAISPDDGIG